MFYVRKCKTVLDSRVHAIDWGFRVLDCGFFVNGTWIPHSNCKWDSGFPELYSGFQGLGSGFQQQKFPAFRNPDIPLHGAYVRTTNGIERRSVTVQV